MSWEFARRRNEHLGRYLQDATRAVMYAHAHVGHTIKNKCGCLIISVNGTFQRMGFILMEEIKGIIILMPSMDSFRVDIYISGTWGTNYGS